MLNSKLAPVAPKKSAPKKSSGSKPVPVTRVSVCEGDREKSVSVRKIENGYIVRETEYGGKGGYKERERFSATAPKIDVAALSPRGNGRK